jgi:hypothetical protein
MLKATEAAENSPGQHPWVASPGSRPFGGQHREECDHDGAVDYHRPQPGQGRPHPAIQGQLMQGVIGQGEGGGG